MIRGTSVVANETIFFEDAAAAGIRPFIWANASPLQERRELQHQLKDTDFYGVSGRVQFNNLQDRAAPLFTVYNLQSNVWVPVADDQPLRGDSGNAWAI